MTARGRTGASIGVCPQCSGTFAWKDRSWACEDCGLVPKHGAD